MKLYKSKPGIPSHRLAKMAESVSRVDTSNIDPLILRIKYKTGLELSEHGLEVLLELAKDKSFDSFQLTSFFPKD